MNKTSSRPSRRSQPIAEPTSPDEVLAILHLTEQGQQAAGLYENLLPLLADADRLKAVVIIADHTLGAWCEAWRDKLPVVRLANDLMPRIREKLKGWSPGLPMAGARLGFTSRRKSPKSS